MQVDSVSPRLEIKKDTWRILFPYALIACLPFASLLLLSILNGHNCLLGSPVLSDELDYWREVYSFSSTPMNENFDSYGFFGYPAHIGSLGCHGLAPIIAYGIPSLIFGWSPNSIVILNAAYCSLALLFFLACCHPNKHQCVLVAVIWFGWPCVSLYITTSMMELFQFAGTIIISTFLILIYYKQHTHIMTALCFVSILVFAGTRITNLIFLIPLFTFAFDFKISIKMLILAIAALIISILTYKFYSAFSAPYPFGFIAELNARESFAEKIMLLSSHAIQNVALFFTPSSSPETVQRVLYLVIMVSSLILYFILKTKRNLGGIVREEFDAHDAGLILLTTFCVLLVFFIALVCLYDVFDWRDFRASSSLLWGQIFLLIGLDFLSLRLEASLGVLIALGCCFTFPYISGRAAFQDNRYEHIEPTVSQSMLLGAIEPTGDSINDRTVVFYGVNEASLIIHMNPRMGIVSHLDNALAIKPDEAAYVLCGNGKSLDSKYEEVLAVDEYRLFKIE